MNCKFFTLLFLIFCLSCSAQKALVLYVFRPTNVKQISFYVKEKISLKLKSERKKYHGTILAIGDSNILISNKKNTDTIAISKIRLIIINHSNYLTESFSYVFAIAGVGIVGIDALNNILNSESKIIKPRIVKTGAVFIVASIVLKILPIRRHKISARKTLKVLTLNPY